MNPLRKLEGAVLDAYALARCPSLAGIVVLYWTITHGMSKRTVADREAAHRAFAAQLLGVNPETVPPAGDR